MDALNKFKAMLGATAAAVGAARSAALSAPQQAANVHTRNGLKGRGKIRRGFGRPHRRTFKHVERLGPFYRQTGWTQAGQRIMQIHFIVKRLHPTKGWRTNTVPVRSTVVPA